MKEVAETKGWPAMNVNAFWTLTERVSDLFTLEKTDKTSATYIFNNTESGEILRAPFQALYNLNFDWPKGHEIRATLFFNTTALETQNSDENENEIDFDIFSQESPFPLCLMKPTDELRIVVSYKEPMYLPVTLGSARVLRFNQKKDVDPFCISTTDTCAITYDGTSIQVFSSANNNANDSDSEYTNLIESIMSSQMDPDEINTLLRNMENPQQLDKLKHLLDSKTTAEPE